MSNPITLPHGANGIEVDDFAIEFRADKVVMLAKSTGEHYTLHSGSNSGVLDLHRTWKDDAGQERHQTVFAIRHDSIPALLGELSLLPINFLGLLRRLRLGWLKRNNIRVVWGLDLVTDDHIAAVTKKRSGRKRLVIDESKWQNGILVPDYLEDIFEFPDGPFSLFAANSRIGIGFKATDPFGHVRLYWLKLRDLTRLANAMHLPVLEACLRHAIPLEKYKDYDFLRR